MMEISTTKTKDRHICVTPFVGGVPHYDYQSADRLITTFWCRYQVNL